MAKSNAERQAAYRARHLTDEDGNGERLNLVIDVHAKRALKRLALCYGVTQKLILEKTILGAERVVLEKVAHLPNGHSEYYDGRLKMTDMIVTP
ncbi:hypothetical protein [Thiomonas sp.]